MLHCDTSIRKLYGINVRMLRNSPAFSSGKNSNGGIAFVRIINIDKMSEKCNERNRKFPVAGTRPEQERVYWVRIFCAFLFSFSRPRYRRWLARGFPFYELL